MDEGADPRAQGRAAARFHAPLVSGRGTQPLQTRPCLHLPAGLAPARRAAGVARVAKGEARGQAVAGLTASSSSWATVAASPRSPSSTTAPFSACLIVASACAGRSWAGTVFAIKASTDSPPDSSRGAQSAPGTKRAATTSPMGNGSTPATPPRLDTWKSVWFGPPSRKESGFGYG